MALPPIPAIGSAFVELYGPPPGAPTWGAPDSVWDGIAWAGVDWQNVTPESMNAKVTWGADTALGVLSVPAAGDWTVVTYDPERKLDPTNPQSPFAVSLHPGNPVRLRYAGTVERIVRQGKIDEISYNVSTKTGNIRATDGVSGLVAAKIPAGTTGVPTTLRAMARYIIALAGLSVPVEPDPSGTDDDGNAIVSDPEIGGPLTDEASVWQWILTGSLDCLYASWMDSEGVLRFRSFGNPRDLGLELGGAEGIPFDDLDVSASLAGIYSRVVAFDDGAPTVPISRTDAESFGQSGDTFYQRDRPVPDGTFWADSVLADRSRADLTYRIGTLRPQTEAQLVALIDTEMVDMAHVRVDSETPPVEAAARTLGGSFEANTSSGWSARVVAYIPGREWEDAEVIPPDPIDPTPPATQTVTRTYAVTKDTRAARTSGGANYGAGTADQLPVGYWQGWRNRAFLDFASIPWGDVVSVVSAELRVTTSTQVNIGFGSAPKVDARRITQSWAEGSLSTPGSSNSTVYPGPSTTSTGSVRKSITTSENALQIIDVSAIVRAWAPTAAGGSGAAKYGIALFSASEDSGSATTEFWAREHGASTDAELRITVKIPA